MKSQNGFTIIEIMISSIIFTLLVAAVVAFTSFYFKNYSFSFEENLSINYAQYALTAMVREIRETRHGEDGAWPLVQTDDNAITFYSDITNDNRADKIRYFLDGTDLKKGVIEPTMDPVTYPPANEKITIITSKADTTAGPIFRYYDGNWPTDTTNNPLPPANRILNTRFINIYIKIDIATNYGSQPFELSSGVQVRGVKDNL